MISAMDFTTTMADISDLKFPSNTLPLYESRLKLRDSLNIGDRDITPIKMTTIVNVIGFDLAIYYIPSFPSILGKIYAIKCVRLLLPNYERMYSDGYAREYIDLFERKVKGDKGVSRESVDRLAGKLRGLAVCYSIEDQEYRDKNHENSIIIEKAKDAARVITMLTIGTGMPSCSDYTSGEIAEAVSHKLRCKIHIKELLQKVFKENSND